MLDMWVKEEVSAARASIIDKWKTGWPRGEAGLEESIMGDMEASGLQGLERCKGNGKGENERGFRRGVWHWGRFSCFICSEGGNF